jgi:diacylglycerol kinase (ATP)
VTTRDAGGGGPDTQATLEDPRAPADQPGRTSRPPADRRIIVFWNPSAGSKAGLPTNASSRGDLLDVMRRHGLGGELVETTSQEDLIERSRQAVTDRYDVVVAAGGDGTVGTVATQLLETGVALGILPLGSLMNICRSLDIPRDLEGAAAIIEAGFVGAIDVGLACGEPFYECASIGINAALFEQAQRIDRGDFVAIIDAVRVLLRYRPARLRIAIDEGILSTGALMVSVANGPYTAFGMTFAPEARLDDGRFDVRIFDRFGRWRILRHLASIVLGRKVHTHEVSTFRSRKVTVTSSRPVPGRADASDLGTTPIALETRPHALRVVIPRSVEALEHDPTETRATGQTKTPPG